MMQRVVKTAQPIAGASLTAIEDIYRKRCLRRATNITKDSYHPAHRLFAPLPSERRYRSLKTRTTRFRNSLFPTAVSLLNSADWNPHPRSHTHTPTPPSLPNDLNLSLFFLTINCAYLIAQLYMLLFIHNLSIHIISFMHVL